MNRMNPTPDAIETTGRKPGEITGALYDLEKGESVTFPAERINSVRATAYNYGFQWGRTFATITDREARTVTVTRTA